MAEESDVDDLLRGYVQPSVDEIRSWWETAEVAVDANVLLNLYRYSADTREQLLAVLRALGERLWIPRRAAEEFARGRLGVLIGQRSAQERIEGLFKRVTEEMETSLQTISRELSRRQGAPTHHERAAAALRGLRDELLAEEQERFGDAADLQADPLLADVKELLRERMGPGLDEDQLAAVCEGARARYVEEIPPGFKDRDKRPPHGDLVIWHEIIERSRSTRLPVIFVTDDAKEDWLQQTGGKTVGPHPRLVRELWERAGVPLLIYNTARFVDYANRELQLGAPVSEEAIAEVRSTPEGHLTDDELRRLTRLWSHISVIGGRATLTLNDPPNDVVVQCSVTDPVGREYGRSWVVLGRSTPLTTVFPDDFALDAPAPAGEYKVTWTEHTPRGVRTPLSELSFRL